MDDAVEGSRATMMAGVKVGQIIQVQVMANNGAKKEKGALTGRFLA